jgi:hypothetical protein
MLIKPLTVLIAARVAVVESIRKLAGAAATVAFAPLFLAAVS